MIAMVYRGGRRVLEARELPRPALAPTQVRIAVRACGVCRTDLHLVDDELPHPKLPVIPGHQVVGTVIERGSDVHDVALGSLVGVPWLGWTCGVCDACHAGRENLCERAVFTGYTSDGGYCEELVAYAAYCVPIPRGYEAAAAAPLLCAGAIGYRALRMVGEARCLGFYGFGASAHILTQVARHRGQDVYAFTRPGDASSQALASRLGAVWVGDSTRPPPRALDAAIIFAAVGPLVPQALAAVRKGGVVVCAGIHMSDITSFPYELLWGERVLRSVANLTRDDVRELMAIAARTPIATTIMTFGLLDAQAALETMRAGKLVGSAVLTIDGEVGNGQHLH